MTTNSFYSTLSLGDKGKNKDIFERLLMKESIKADEFLKELTNGGFDNESFSKALLTYTEYNTNNFEKPQIFTKSYKNINIKFTNHINMKHDNKLILSNLQLLKDNIVGMLSGLKIIEKDIQNDKRLKRICEFYEWDLEEEVDPENHNLFKFEGNQAKSKNNHYSNPFRVFVGITNITTEPKKIRLLFIDPHHLAVPSGHRYSKNGPWVKGSQVVNNTYSQCQYYEHHIYELIEEKLKV